MTHINQLIEIEQRWKKRRDEWNQLGVSVEGASVCNAVLADLRTLRAAEDDQPLTLTEAARISGYSREHLGRMVRSDQIANAGRSKAPRIHRRDLPRKTGYLPPEDDSRQIQNTSKRQIVRSVAGLERRPNAEKA